MCGFLSLIPSKRLLNSSVKINSVITISAIPILSLVLSACTNSLTTGQEIVFPSSNVSYSKQVQPLFNLDCVSSGCHNTTDAAQAGGLDLTSYFSLTSAPGVVVARDTTSSKLIEYVTGRLQPVMPPPPYSQLNPNQIQGLKTWIMEGAKFN